MMGVFYRQHDQLSFGLYYKEIYACVRICIRYFCNGFFSFFVLLGPLGLIIVWHFLKKCGNAAMLQSVKNTMLLFINMSISWWKLHERTCQEEINKLMCSWYMMRVHRDVEKIRNGLDWSVETWIRSF